MANQDMIMNNWSAILEQFLLQAQREDLKTSPYPKEWAGLKMRVSFGMGTPARVPWIAFISPEMRVSRGFYPVYLYYKELGTLILAYGVSETEEPSKSWPAEIMNTSPAISTFFSRDVPRYGSSFVFKAYKVNIDNENVEIKYFDEKSATDKNLESDLTTILDYYQKIVSNEIKEEDSTRRLGLGRMEVPLHSSVSRKTKHIDVHHQKFVQEVGNFFKKAGFKQEEVIIKGPTTRGADIVLNHVTEDNRRIRILVQCKESEEPKEFRELQRLIDEYSTKVRDEKADLALLILNGYSIPAEYRERDKIDEIRSRKKVIYWDDDVWRFYKATVRSMHQPYSRYMILRDFGYSIVLQKAPYIVDAFEIKQSSKGGKIWVFAIEPEKLLNISYVFRRGSRDPEAYQRILKPRRLRKIGEFLSEEKSMLVNNIVIAFEEGAKYHNGKLEIPAVTGSAWIIDGQHRLFGFCNIKGSKRERREVLSRYKLIVAGIKAEPKVQAKLFKEINQYQERLDRNLLLDLQYYLGIEDEEGTLQRIKIAKKLGETEVFKNRIKVLKTGKGTITLATIVDYPIYAKLIKSAGNKAFTILRNFFSAFYDVFKDEWLDSDEKYIFSTNKGVRMLISLCDRTINYLRRNKKPYSFEQMKQVIMVFKETIKDNQELLLRESYIGKALGAGAPDIVSRDLWAARIDSKLDKFLSEEERQAIGRDERDSLLMLEEKMRQCIENALGKLSPNWWKERIPDDVRKNSEDKKIRNEKPWPWLEQKDRPLICYLDFNDYEKVIVRNDNWRDIFKLIFKDQTITVAKLRELDLIRNDIAHNRKLTIGQFERLKMYKTDLISCIDAFQGQQTEQQ